MVSKLQSDVEVLSFRFLCLFLLFFFFFFFDLVEGTFDGGQLSLTVLFLRFRCSRLSSSEESEELVVVVDDEGGEDDRRRFRFTFGDEVEADAVLSAISRSRFFLSSSWNLRFMWSSQAASVLEPCFFFSMIRFTSSQVGLVRLR